MKLYLFLRSIIWTAVFAVSAFIASLIAAFINPPLAIPLALIGIGMATLAPRREL